MPLMRNKGLTNGTYKRPSTSGGFRPTSGSGPRETLGQVESISRDPLGKDWKDVLRSKIDICIEEIAKSPFGKKNEGREIVRKLRSLNINSKIIYRDFRKEYKESGEDQLGNWDGKEIAVTEKFRNNTYLTIPVLVHEATHAISPKNPWDPHNDRPDWCLYIADEEYRCIRNEREIYLYLKGKVDFTHRHWEYLLGIRLHDYAVNLVRKRKMCSKVL